MSYMQTISTVFSNTPLLIHTHAEQAGKALDKAYDAERAMEGGESTLAFYLGLALVHALLCIAAAIVKRGEW